MWEAIVGGSVAGLIAGVIIVLGERFVFQPAETRRALKRAGRQLRHRVLRTRGELCTECGGGSFTGVASGLVPAVPREDGTVETTQWAVIRCLECGHERLEEQEITLLPAARS